MKKIFVLFCLVFIILAGQPVHAQTAVVDAALTTLLGYTQFEQIANFVIMIEQGANQIIHLKNQAENMANTFQMQVNNLSRIGEIKSWDDFKDWHNRQLYLERKTEETFTGMNISIGNKNYSLWDVEGIAYGVKDTYVDYWDREFTEDQQKEMWLRMGLTPSNYAYVQTWKEREKDIARRFLTAPAVQNEESMEQAEQANKFKNRLAEDSGLDLDQKISEKELLAMQAELLISNNLALNNIAMSLAELMELEAVKLYQAQTPISQPVLSEWPDDVFKRLTD